MLALDQFPQCTISQCCNETSQFNMHNIGWWELNHTWQELVIGRSVEHEIIKKLNWRSGHWDEFDTLHLKCIYTWCWLALSRRFDTTRQYVTILCWFNWADVWGLDGQRLR